ncbi:CCA tRNA nucleotidyltransferase [Martelella lutilitoris]|uniref:CCA tRNA nucleotidyltransferase n=1 Tax=Martelella lutilitoris TaxID=2583532 RepID=A0A7T7HL94_9HYPH|nr:CCA tRNA nucleotidyltransferase [Martelella lutilitoris]QQM31207.1 CCA tRNA nucleotidyltransferase [Martelella lutilitoris]
MKTVKDDPWFRENRLQKVLDVLNGDGGETRIVGGAVRNALMGMPVGDIDMATTLVPEEVAARAKNAGMKPVPTGIAHGTVTVVCEGKPFEVTTLRADVETFGRHATVRFGTDWAEDAARRDLTINALYADRDGRVIDLVGGLADIETRTVRFIGEAETRITEDYLRILRFFRFFAWYGGGRPDAAGLKASVRHREGLKTLSAERIWAEMKKLLAAGDPSRALLWMRQTGVLTIVLPESEKWGIDAVPGLIDAETHFGWRPDSLLRLAAIVPPYDVRLKEMAERLKFSNAERDLILSFAAAPVVTASTSAARLRRLLYTHGKQGLMMRLKLSLSDARSKAAGGDAEAVAEAAGYVRLIEAAELWEKPEMPISGGDIVDAGVLAGPEVGRILASLERQWVEGDFELDRAALAARLDALMKGED